MCLKVLLGSRRGHAVADSSENVLSVQEGGEVVVEEQATTAREAEADKVETQLGVLSVQQASATALCIALCASLLGKGKQQGDHLSCCACCCIASKIARTQQCMLRRTVWRCCAATWPHAMLTASLQADAIF